MKSHSFFIKKYWGLLPVLLASYLPLGAQLCQGSLGDPIVNITFGSGANPAPPLAAATTSYEYVFTDCPEDGYYAVRNSSSFCFFNTWHDVTSDHTGNTGGYFMLVNASFQPSAFYLETVRGLCASTTYEFAAWLMNVLRPSACQFQGLMPNLTFTIENTDGTVLQTYDTGDIPATNFPTWKQFGFFFTTPAGVSDVVLRIFNNAPGGCGNDIALDDITFRPCGPLVSTSIVGYPETTVTYCEGPARDFNFLGNVSAGISNPALQWQQRIDGGPWLDIPGATGFTYFKSFPANTNPGIYEFRMSASAPGNIGSVRCRVSSLPLKIDVAAIPVTTITTNSPVCEGMPLTFSAVGDANYDWTGINNYAATGNPVSIAPSSPVHSGKYYMLATSIAGCTYFDSTVVSVNPKPTATTNINESTFCEGAGIQLEASGGISYQWLPAEGLSSSSASNPWADPTDTVEYNVVVYNEYSCTDTASVLLNVIEKPRANAGPDRTILEGNSTQLLGSIAGQQVTFSWLPSNFMIDMQTLLPLVSPPADINYVLTAVSAIGCGSHSDTVHIFVYKDIFVPTAFTPNGDGLNDTWYIPPLNALSLFTVTVYNRFGQIVFRTKDANIPWDGKYNGTVQPVGVYVYLIELREEKRILKGTVTLIR